jgi:hypothetical protein
MLWPLHANGVSGMALRPHYNEYFSFTTYEQLPDHPTNDDLRHAGVRLPVDVVWRRRHIAEILAGTGVVLAAAGLATMRSNSRHNQPEPGDDGFSE